MNHKKGLKVHENNFYKTIIDVIYKGVILTLTLHIILKLVVECFVATIF